ncbi:hypothetical protein [Halobacteriovorax sp. JY17]|uniref:hypothetical protein n=1 Tax=Halobacteriovorax sp. JY17 TaxID=2014617 RepID=UPI000C4283C1|nr:hypothetical protein [Halobacteriovorax sp. JY17]PIK13594.1 MAG: hypothetical protein CES88_15500 [Halobacteriovorax sp. JY17]
MSIENLNGKIIIKTSLLTRVFCLIVVLAGVYQGYLFLSGGLYDLLGLTLSFLIPFIVLNFIYPSQITIFSDEEIVVLSKFLFRAQELKLKVSEIKLVELRKSRGGSTSGNFSIDISMKDGSRKFIPTFSKLYSRDARECLENFLRTINTRC